MAEPIKKPRGLAYMKINDPQRFAEIVKKGGLSSKNRFDKNPELARRAGLRSGEVRSKK